MPENLTREQQRQIEQVVNNARRDDGIPRTAQQSIPFERMFADGICRVRDNYYTKTIQYQDINYQLATQEDQKAIFDEWCGFLNFFDSSIRFELSFVNRATEEIGTYEIPGEALTDTRFSNMIREAENYLGYEYVWGGSSPATGFDCSGFVSYVINHCGNGWDVGRLTANRLSTICSAVSEEDAKPGDLIFFQGTYQTRGMSHVGIYVGDGMMLHAGNPIQYVSVNTSYWQSHLAGFGRLP